MSSTRQDPIVRLAHVVGDFGNPFYAEERQRDVWNEASAFGFQLVLWCALVGSTATVWLVGAPAVPYVCAAMLLVGGVSGLTIAYAQHLGVELGGRDRMLRWRLLPYAVLVVALLVGLLRAQEESLEASTVAGMVTGAGAVLLVMAVALRRRSQEP
jgi:hypothetical protein